MIWLYLALVAIGLLSIFSVTFREGDNVVQSFLVSRPITANSSISLSRPSPSVYSYCLRIASFFTATANIWYAAGISLLLLVFPFHTEVKGTESIIRLRSFQLCNQPSW